MCKSAEAQTEDMLQGEMFEVVETDVLAERLKAGNGEKTQKILATLLGPDKEPELQLKIKLLINS